MPRININEIDNTVYSINELTNDNIVYVPGNAITGEYKFPVLVTSIDQFESQFGNHSPEGSPTYDYVRGLLIAGLPVLFRRIAGSNMDSDLSEIKIIKAEKTLSAVGPQPELPTFTTEEVSMESTEEDITINITSACSMENWTGNVEVVLYDQGVALIDEVKEVSIREGQGSGNIELSINKEDPIFEQVKALEESITPSNVTLTAVEESEEVPQLKVQEMYGGSYGNSLKVSIEQIGQSYYFRVYQGVKVIESELICNVGSEDTEETLRAKELEFFNTQQFRYVTVEIVNEKPEEFMLPFGSWELIGGEDISEADVLEEIPRTYDFISDRYVYDVKFITAGGYTDPDLTTTTLSTAEVKICEQRKDCFAILDVPYGTAKSQVTNYFSNIDSSYAAAFAPWCYTRLPSGESKWMSPSYLFLYTLGRSIQDGNHVYDAPAGVLKASMPQVLKPEYEIGGDILDYWTTSNPQCINPLMKLQSYGYVIFGQNTLYNIQNKNTLKASALQKINVRLAINEVRRLLFKAAIRMTFQANTVRTWNMFKAIVEPDLNLMVSNQGISDYKIVMDNTTTTDEDLATNTIRAKAYISIMNAVENFEIDFYIEPQSLKFADEDNEKNVMIS